MDQPESRLPLFGQSSTDLQQRFLSLRIGQGDKDHRENLTPRHDVIFGLSDQRSDNFLSHQNRRGTHELSPFAQEKDIPQETGCDDDIADKKCDSA